MPLDQKVLLWLIFFVSFGHKNYRLFHCLNCWEFWPFAIKIALFCIDSSWELIPEENNEPDQNSRKVESTMKNEDRGSVRKKENVGTSCEMCKMLLKME